MIIVILKLLIDGYIYTDPLSEKRSRKHWYVPRDEAFSEVKQLTFSAKTMYSVMHALVPSLEMAISDTDLGFKYFTAIDSLFHEGIHLPPFKEQGVLKALLPRLVNVMASGDDVLRFVPPETMNSKQIPPLTHQYICIIYVRKVVSFDIYVDANFLLFDLGRICTYKTNSTLG